MKLSSRRIRRAFALFVVPTVISPCAGAGEEGHKTFIIASPGSPTLDGTDTIHGPSLFALSERGLVYQSMAVTSGIDTINAVRHTGTREIFREGTVIPGFGTVTGMMGNLATNRDVAVLTVAYIRDSAGVTREALVAGSSPQDLRVVVIADQTVPGGNGQFNSFIPGSINDRGEVGFWGSIKNGGGPLIETNGVFLAKPNGTITQIVRNKATVPGEPYNFTSVYGGRTMKGGEVHFFGTINDPAQTTGYYRSEGSGELTRLVRSRRPAPGTPYSFGSINTLSAANSGDCVIHSTLINGSNQQTGWGIFRGEDIDHLTAVAYTGQAAPSGAGYYTSFENMPSVNDEGKLVYVGHCSGGNTKSGLFLHEGGQHQLIVKAGQIAPGGATYTGFGVPRVNDSGTMLFAANLNGGTTFQGIYLTDGTDTIKVVQAGDAVDGKTVQSIGIDPKAFNGFNQVAYQAYLSGTNGPSILLFAPRLKWRGSSGGLWGNAANWTASLVPSEYNDVDVVPPDGVLIMGPPEDIVVRSLSIGTEGEGLADFQMGAGIITATGGVAIEDGGMLSGSGSIVGNLANASVLSPGNSPGVIALAGNYSQASSGGLKMEIAGAGEGQFDRLTITGNAVLAGTLEVELIGDALSTLREDSSLVILTAEGEISGQFAGQPDGSRIQVADGLASFLISYQAHAVVLSGFLLLDSDSDGICDYWMMEHFGQAIGSPESQSMAADDPDGDGSGNSDEFIAGTDPHDGTDVFAAGVAALDSDNISVSFPTVSGREYRVEFSPDLKVWETVRSGIEGDGSVKSVEIPLGDPAPVKGYYRAIVVR